MPTQLIYLDKYGWPVERVKGRWFLNFIRLLIHTETIKRADPAEYLKTKYNPKPDEDTQTNGGQTNGNA